MSSRQAWQLSDDAIVRRLEELSFCVDEDEQAAILEEVYERVHVEWFIPDKQIHENTLVLRH